MRLQHAEHSDFDERRVRSSEVAVPFHAFDGRQGSCHESELKVPFGLLSVLLLNSPDIVLLAVEH